MDLVDHAQRDITDIVEITGLQPTDHRLPAGDHHTNHRGRIAGGAQLDELHLGITQLQDFAALQQPLQTFFAGFSGYGEQVGIVRRQVPGACRAGRQVGVRDLCHFALREPCADCVASLDSTPRRR